MDAFTVAALSAASLSGLGGSLHCAGMCGPLACVPLPKGQGRLSAAVAWQLGRAGGYAAVGAAAGAAGSALLGVAPQLLQAAPWLVVAGLTASALEFPRRLPDLPGLAAVRRSVTRVSARFSPTTRAAAFGALTPLLPCGLVLGAAISAAGMGSALLGAALMAAFALGAVPALLAMQGLWGGAAGMLGARAQRWRRVMLLGAAAVVAFRALKFGEHADGPPDCR
ncbi:MAG: sulfite exporter TauE/SafE family protein [Myxococcaceae bacterium]|nr:sulfite exporter TauE/SafE family protein [Myxococcaceae bacterium]